MHLDSGIAGVHYSDLDEVSLSQGSGFSGHPIRTSASQAQARHEFKRRNVTEREEELEMHHEKQTPFDACDLNPLVVGR